MKSRMLRVLAVIFLALFFNSHCAAAFMNDVSGGPQDWALRTVVEPETPTVYDSISIVANGTVGSGPFEIEQSVFQVDGLHLSLDIDVRVDMLTVVTPWSHTENIGALPAGSYDLAVTANYYFAGWASSEEYHTSFEVVPEPITLSLLALGSLFVRRR